MKKLLLPISYTLMGIGMLITICLLYYTYKAGYSIGFDNIDFNVTGQFADYFGGVIGTLFSAAGILFIVLTFIQQSEREKKEDFEKKFYQMLQLHRENVQEIHIDNLYGRAAIESLVDDELRLFHNAVKNIINRIRNSENKYLFIKPNEPEVFEKARLYLDNEHNRVQLIHLLSYGYFFNSISKYRITTDKEDIRYDLNSEVVLLLEGSLFATPKSNLRADTYYNNLLGHYFKHLYQMIELIVKQDKNILNEDEKNEFIKILSAQLSGYEQLLLYYHSLSTMGQKWCEPLGIEKIKEMCFIARFRLIKDIPSTFDYFGIHPAELFKIEIAAWKKLGKEFFETEISTNNYPTSANR